MADRARIRELNGGGMRLDRLGAVLAVPALAAFLVPAFVARASRIAVADQHGLIAALPQRAGMAFGAVIVAVTLLMLFLRHPALRLLVAAGGILGLLLLAGFGADRLLADLGKYGRVSPGAALWIWLAVSLLWFTDALARLRLPPVVRMATGFGLLFVAGLIGKMGLLDSVSVMVEYHARMRSFQQELQTHVLLALGSFATAMAIGFPLGLYLHRRALWRGPVLAVLTAVQTVPSIALFGLMILPLAWLAAQVPGVAALGISGIGFAPAFAALLLYSLLPVTANTVSGLRGLSPAVLEVARAMGMTDKQRRWQVEIPLALPVILTGARIVLVQNIGLATVGALIGAGGLGSFVFQGLAQGAMDLVLLGAIPTVILAFVVARLFDTVIAALAVQQP